MIFCQMSSSFNKVGVLCECKMRKKIILNIRKTQVSFKRGEV